MGFEPQFFALLLQATSSAATLAEYFSLRKLAAVGGCS